MGAIEDFAASVTTKLGTIAAGLDAIDGDVTNLQNQISALQAALGTVTPDQQALLDGISSTLDSLGNKVGDIDTRTPPVA